MLGTLGAVLVVALVGVLVLAAGGLWGLALLLLAMVALASGLSK